MPWWKLTATHIPKSHHINYRCNWRHAIKYGEKNNSPIHTKTNERREERSPIDAIVETLEIYYICMKLRKMKSDQDMSRDNETKKIWKMNNREKKARRKHKINNIQHTMRLKAGLCRSWICTLHVYLFYILTHSVSFIGVICVSSNLRLDVKWQSKEPEQNRLILIQLALCDKSFESKQ